MAHCPKEVKSRYGTAAECLHVLERQRPLPSPLDRPQQELQREFVLGALQRRGECLEGRQPPGQVCAGLDMRGAPDGLVSSLDPIRHGLGAVASRGVVRRQELGR